jgi:putative spermidine/putrescine transport system ATP-binding protein
VFVTHDQNEAMAVADRLVVMSKGQIRQVGTPIEIYETPADVFVAAFIGQANLLRGQTVEFVGEHAKVTFKDGLNARVRRSDTSIGCGPATLALRPEDLRISSSSQPDMNNFPGVVTRVNYMGSSLNIGVSTGEIDLTIATSRRDRMVTKGENVVVHWPYDVGILLSENA